MSLYLIVLQGAESYSSAGGNLQWTGCVYYICTQGK